MDPAYVSSLEATLKQITNAGTVNEATERLQKEFYSNDAVIPALVHILQSSPEPQVRQLAGVEARKQVADKWLAVDDNYKTEIRSSLLNSTMKEENALVRHTMSRVISEVATTDLSEMLSGSNQWPELLPFLFGAIRSQNVVEREVGVYVLYTLLDADVEPLRESKAELLHLFAQTIEDSSLQVRISTVSGLQSLSDTIDAAGVPANTPADKNPVELFRALIPATVNVLKQTIQEGDEKGASDVFEFFTNLLVVDGPLVSKHLGQLCEFMLREIALQKELDEELRMWGLRFLLSAVQFKKSKIQSLKLGPALVEASLDIMAEDEEDDEEEDLEDTPSGTAFRLLSCLSSNLAPSQVIRTLLELFPRYAQGSTGQRIAAFNAISATVEGAPDYFANEIDTILPVIVEGLRDSHLSVVGAALYALSELTSILEDLVTEKHEVLLPMICNILDGATTLKIGKYACHALDAMLDSLDQEVMVEKYLNSLVPKLLQLLDGAQNLRLKSAIVAAISSAANSAGSAFQPYFEHTCQSVQSFIKTPTSPEEELPSDEVALCGITFDLLSAIAGAVGRDNFRPFVEPLINAAYNCIQCEQTRMKECGFIFIGTIARVYGQEFSQFLGKIVPELFKSLEQDEMAGLLDAIEEGAVGMDDDEEEGNEKFMATSAIINEKEIAFEALGEIIQATQGDFAPYLEQACTLLADNCSHYHPPLATMAINSLWKAFVTFYKLSNPDKWQQGFPAQYEVSEPSASIGLKAREEALMRLAEADDRTVATAICDRFAEAIKLAGPWVFGNAEDLEKLLGEVILILTKQHPSQTMEDEFEYDGHKQDAEEDQESSEYDEVLIDSALDVVVQLAGALGGQFKPMWGTIFPLLEKYSTNPASKNDRSAGVGAIAEIVNGLRQECTEFTADIYNIFLRALDDRDLEVRSNAAYGAGLLVRYSNDKQFIEANLMAILQKLQRLLKKVEKEQRKFGNIVDESDSSEDGLANACGCVSRMALSYPNLVPISQVMPVLLQHLPLKSAFEENAPIFELIVDQFEKQNESVAGVVKQIVDIIEQVFIKQADLEQQISKKATPLVNAPTMPLPDAQTEGRVVQLLKFLEAKEPGLVSSRPVLAKALSV